MLRVWMNGLTNRTHNKTFINVSVVQDRPRNLEISASRYDISMLRRNC